MKAGKLPLDLLSKLLDGIPQDDPRVVVGPKAGEDAALIENSSGNAARSGETESEHAPAAVSRSRAST